MSPEQVRGAATDQRTDLFSFGAVLYELLGGQRAFRGQTSADVVTAILKEDPPDLPVVERHIPLALARIVDRCLEKSPARRFQSASDLAFALQALSTPSGATTSLVATPQPGRARMWIVAGVAGAALITALAYGTARLTRPAPVAGVTTAFPLTLSEGWTLSLGQQGGASLTPLAVSPDGRQIAFLATSSDGQRMLWVRVRDTIAARMLPGTENAMSPFWSPDGRYLAFFSGGQLKKIDVNGGPPIKLCDTPPNPTGGAWSRAGIIVFGTNISGEPLLRVPDSGGQVTALTSVTEGEVQHLRPMFLPDGRHFLFRVYVSGTRGPIYLASLDSPERTPLLESDSTNIAYSSGHLLFLRDATLMAQPFDVRRLALTGEPFPIAEPIQALGNWPSGVFSASENGVLAYQHGSSIQGSQLVWFDRRGAQVGIVGERGTYTDLRLSPDGKRVAVSRRGQGLGNNTSDIWLFDTQTGLPTRFTFDAGNEYAVAWSPDSRQLVFNSSRKGFLDLYQRAADGSGSETELLADKQNKFPFGWSPDGRFVLYSVPGRGRGEGSRGAPGDARGAPAALARGAQQRLWGFPISGDRTPFQLADGLGSETPGSLSPDGRWLAYTSTETGRPEVYVTTFPPTKTKWQVSSSSGGIPQWGPDGKEIVYLDTAQSRPTLMSARLEVQGAAIRVLGVQKLFTVTVVGARGTYGISPDGQRFLINTLAVAQTPTTEPATVVVDWLGAKNGR